MSPEGARKRFQKEKSGGYSSEEGAWASVLLLARDVNIPGRFFGGEEDSFWANIEEKAKMKPKRACFQFYLAGVGHRSLAERIVASFPNIRTSAALDPIANEQKKNLIEELGGTLYPLYPKKYRLVVPR